MTPALQALRIKEAEAIGYLTAIVHGMLLSHDHNLEIREKDWARLREAFNAREAAFKATTDLLCGGSYER